MHSLLLIDVINVFNSIRKIHNSLALSRTPY